MKLFAATLGLGWGLILVSILSLIEVVVQAFVPNFVLPFSIWWGLVISLPGFAFAILIASMER